MDTMKKTNNWSDLPKELLELLLKRLTLLDHLRFGTVCKSWRSVLQEKRQPQLLWLIIPTTHAIKTCVFLNLLDNSFYNIELREILDLRCCGSSQGWLIMGDFDIAPKMFLLNPFSKAQFQLPRCPQKLLFFEKVIVSSMKNTLVVMGIHMGRGGLGYCRLGDKSWKTFDEFYGFQDVLFYKQQFYAVNHKQEVVICDFDVCPPRARLLEVAIPPEPMKNMKNPIEFRNYLVESYGELLLVSRIQAGGRFQLLKTTGFIVFKLDISESKWIRVERLGDRALFLGRSSSMSVLARDFPVCKENCIYFTDDSFDCYRFQCRDLGVFDMNDGSIRTIFSGDSRPTWSPPIWVTSNPWKRG